MDLDVKFHAKQFGMALLEATLSRTVVGIVTDTIFGYLTRVKMERAQGFTGGFLEDIKSSDPDKIDWEYLLSEEFLDSFYSVLRRVINTASEEKIRRFKKILLNEATRPYKSDFKETFLDIAFRINEDQIQILKHFWNVKDGCESEDNSEQKVVDGEGAEASLKYKANLLGFDEAMYLFYVQDLISKSLLLDEAIALFGGRTKPYINLRITPFGEEFLKFIEGSPDQ